MPVDEAARRPDEFGLLGMYDSDPGVVKAKRAEWAALHRELPVYPSVDAALESEAEAVVVEGRVYENLDYAERALNAGKHVLLGEAGGRRPRSFGAGPRAGPQSRAYAADGVHVALQPRNSRDRQAV